MKAITKTIWILSLVSLFTDLASEMLYPMMPMYLKTIGFSVLFIGILEGIAEAVASLSKGYFGRLSDAKGARAPFVKAGYALSAVSKPLLAVFANIPWVFLLRTSDRCGKGLRTAARDAILADESAPADRGKVFGFHRTMDTLGAAMGPAVALLFLYFNRGEYKPLFYISFVPGVIAVSLTFLIHDRKHTNNDAPVPHVKPRFIYTGYWKLSTPVYRRLLSGLLFFALFNSSDMFLILKLKDSGVSDTLVIAIYIFYNLVYALSAFPIGIIADRLGLKKMFLTGIALFVVVYFGMALVHDTVVFIVLFFLYGLYYACTEGIAKAWITVLCKADERATAVGFFSGLQGIAALLASTLAGVVWYSYGYRVAFSISASAAAVVFLFFAFSRSVNPDVKTGA